MAKLNVRYFTNRKNKNGQARYFWQPSKTLAEKGWKLQRLPDTYHEALAKAEAINARVDQWRAGKTDTADNTEPGTLDALIEKYKASPRYKDLGAATVREYDYCLKVISEWAGTEQARHISSEMVDDLYAAMKEKIGERRAAYVVQVLRMLYNFAPKPDFAPPGFNPAGQTRLTYKAKKGRLWSRAAVDAFIKAADDMGYFSIGTAVMMNEWIGQRMGDILRLPETAYKDGILTVGIQSKTGADVPPLDLKATGVVL